MKKINFVIISILFNIVIINGQWQRIISGSGTILGSCIIQTSDGGYALDGEYEQGSWPYIYVAKLDSNCIIQWTKTIAVSSNSTNGATSIIQTYDGGFAISGFSEYFSGTFDMFVAKLNSNGSLQWSRFLSKNTGPNADDFACNIIQIIDSGFIVVGNTNNYPSGDGDIFIIKLSQNGSLQWSKIVEGISGFPNSAIKTKDNGYAIAGYTNNVGAGGADMLLLKLDNNLNLQWTKTIGGVNDDYANSITQSIDSGYILCGGTLSFGAGNKDVYLVKFSSKGVLQWTKTVGGTSNEDASSIITTYDGGFALAGYTNSYGLGGSDMFILKFFPNGILQWAKTLGGPNLDAASYILQTSNGEYVIAGYSNSFSSSSSFYIVKLDTGGNTCGNSISPSPVIDSGGILQIPNIIIDTFTVAIASPSLNISSGGTLTNLCILDIQSISSQITNSFFLFQNYPNPFNPTTKIKFEIPNSKSITNSKTEIRIYDVLGKEVATLVNEKLQPGTYEVEWNASNYASGIYFYKMVGGDFTETKRMALIK